MDYAAGELILIDKPKTWTSFDVVNKIRYALRGQYGKIKVGHAGTLDPLATGLLLICTGKMTKEIDGFMGKDKTYTGMFRLGATTPSFDAETEHDREFELPEFTLGYLQEMTRSFHGELQQIPPAFSAVKINGQAAYVAARKGKEVEINARPVHIRRFDITAYESPLAAFEVECSKGTYIRSLARDFGQTLGNGAYLQELRRTAIGNYRVSDAFSLPDFLAQLKKETE